MEHDQVQVRLKSLEQVAGVALASGCCVPRRVLGFEAVWVTEIR